MQKLQLDYSNKLSIIVVLSDTKTMTDRESVKFTQN